MTLAKKPGRVASWTWSRKLNGPKADRLTDAAWLSSLLKIVAWLRHATMGLYPWLAYAASNPRTLPPRSVAHAVA